MARTNHTLPTEYSNATEIRCTVDLQSVRIFHGSVWFVRAIGFAYFLWHGQTIRFRRKVRTQVKFAVMKPCFLLIISRGIVPIMIHGARCPCPKQNNCARTLYFCSRIGEIVRDTTCLST